MLISGLARLLFTHINSGSRSVEGIPLLGDESGVTDDPAQLFFCRAMVGAGGGDDVFLDHDTADVVAAEAEAELAGLESRRHPGRLDILYILEINTGNRQRL
jgi:hypothetical protein